MRQRTAFKPYGNAFPTNGRALEARLLRGARKAEYEIPPIPFPYVRVDLRSGA